MPPRQRRSGAESTTAPDPNDNKSKVRATSKQTPTAASSRPRRVAKPIENEPNDAPEPDPKPRKRKRAEEEEVKRKENTKKHTGNLEHGEMTVRTGYDGHEETTFRHQGAFDATTKAHGENSFWLMKAEPLSRIERGKDVKFSIDDLKAAEEPEGWDGVRNMAARNNMRAMKEGDLAFFYHSNCPKPGVAGTMAIVKEHSIDKSAHDPEHPYYDPKSTEDSPKWSLVHVEFRRKFPHLVTLKELQSHSKEAGSPLENLQTLKQSRLSVSKVSMAEWIFINELATAKVENVGEGASTLEDLADQSKP